MIGLEKVTGRITAEAEEDSAQLLAAAGEKCSQIAQAADEKIAGVKEKINSELIAECENIITRTKSTASMKKRNIILEAKGKALDNAFINAEKELCSMPREKYLAFLTKHIGEAVDSTADASSCGIILNKTDRDQVGEELVGLLSVKRPDISFVLSQETRPISGGALLDLGDTDVDCSIHSLLLQYRPALEARICSILFEDALS